MRKLHLWSTDSYNTQFPFPEYFTGTPKQKVFQSWLPHLPTCRFASFPHLGTRHCSGQKPVSILSFCYSSSTTTYRWRMDIPQPIRNPLSTAITISAGLPTTASNVFYVCSCTSQSILYTAARVIFLKQRSNVSLLHLQPSFSIVSHCALNEIQSSTKACRPWATDLWPAPSILISFSTSPTASGWLVSFQFIKQLLIFPASCLIYTDSTLYPYPADYFSTFRSAHILLLKRSLQDRILRRQATLYFSFLSGMKQFIWVYLVSSPMERMVSA